MLPVLSRAVALLARLNARWQARVLFAQPCPVKTSAPGPYPARQFEAFTVNIRGANLHGWGSVRQSNSPARGVVVWFGGRKEHVQWANDLTGWLGEQWDVVAFQYRGTGESEGAADEKACVLDGVDLVHWAIAHYRTQNVIIAGRSMGTAIAMKVCTRIWDADVHFAYIRGLVLVSPMTKLEDVLLSTKVGRRLKWLWFPIRRLIAHPLANQDEAQRVRVPTLVVYGQEDELVTPEQSRTIVEILEQHSRKPIYKTEVEVANHRTVLRGSECLRAIAQFAWQTEF